MKSYLHNITFVLVFTLSVFSNYSYSQNVNSGVWSTGDWHHSTATAGCNTITLSSTGYNDPADDDPMYYNGDASAMNSIYGPTFMDCDATTYSDAGIYGGPSLAVLFDMDSYGGGTPPNEGWGFITFTFALPVTNPIIHIERIGGQENGIANSVLLEIQNGLTLTELTQVSSNFIVTSTTINSAYNVPSTSVVCGSGANNASGGSVQINGTNITTVKFRFSKLGQNVADEIEIAWSLPPSPGTAIPDANTPCEGETLTLFDNSTNNTSWEWAGPNGFSSSIQNPTITNVTTNASGIYTVTTYDINGCPGINTIDVNINPKPIANAGNDIQTCDNNVTITATGGGTYQWNNGLGSGASHTVSPSVTTEYIVTVTSSFGCTDIDTVNVSLGSLGFDTTITNATCYNGTNGEIDLTLSGTAPYSINWSNGAISQNITNLNAGNYTVTVNDNLGCNLIETFIISQPSEIQSQSNITNILCYGNTDGQIDLTVSGGTAPYTFVWDNTSQTSNIITGLSPNTYTVTITDANNCTNNHTATITQATELAAIATATNICFGATNGQIALNVSGGTSPYTFAWDNTTQTTANITNLNVNTYTVTVTDNNGCTITQSASITQSSEITSSINTTNISCFGLNDGQANIAVSGGIAPYTYNWSNTSQTSANITNLSANTYDVTITDANNCTSTQTTSITEPTVLTTSTNTTNILCYGNTDGQIDLTVSGGTAPYTYLWNNSQTTEDITNLAPNTYNVVVTDANNCVSLNSATINSPTQLTSSANPVNVSCFGLSDGEIDLNVSGGTPPYSYNWSNNQQTEDINNLAQNIYIVTITDANNCLAIDTGEISEPIAITINQNSNSILCYGDQTGQIDIDIIGGVSPYTYNWSNQATSQDLTNITAGTYNLTVTDNSGCSKITQISLNQPNELIVSLPNNYTYCNHNTEILANVEGGTTPYSYIWDNGSTNQTSTYQTSQTQTYSVTVTDNNGCTSTDDITIYISSIDFEAFVNKDTVCPGDPVLVTTNIIGGMPPFTIYDNGQVSTFPVVVYPNGQQNYTLQVIDACGNTANTIVDINTYPTIPLSFSADILQGCAPLKVHFNQDGYSTSFNYNWTFDDIDENNLSFSINPIHIFTESGKYDITVSVTDNNGCKNQQTIQNMIEVYPKPNASFEAENEVVSFIDANINFDNYSTNNYNNFWYFGDGDKSSNVNPSHEYQSVGIYHPMLVVESDKGCLDTAIHKIEIQDEFTLYIPTAFSPDGDAINDEFKAVGHGIDLDNYYIAVYDRWGEIIWTSTDLFESWKGNAKGHNKKVQNGTYKWVVVCKDFNGVEHTKSGNVTVIR